MINAGLFKQDKIKNLAKIRIYTHRWALAQVAVYYCRLQPTERKFTEDVFLKLLYLANDMISDHEFHVSLCCIRRSKSIFLKLF